MGDSHFTYLKSQRSDVWVKVGGWSIDPLDGVERVGDVSLTAVDRFSFLFSGPAAPDLFEIVRGCDICFIFGASQTQTNIYDRLTII